MKKLLFLLMLAIFVAACKPTEPDVAPVAGFTITNNNCQATCVVTFQNTSTGTDIVTYLWDFGDGTNGSTRDAVHSYNAGGNYTTTLTVTTGTGKRNATQQLVTIGNSSALPPSKCKIKLISISEFPIYPGNATSFWYWDDNELGDNRYADGYFEVSDDLGINYTNSSAKANIVQSYLPFLWQEGTSGTIVNTVIPFTNFTQNYRLRFWDADNSNDDIIKDFNFKPVDYFPANNQVGETQFTIYATGGGFGNGGVLNGIVVLEWYN